MARLDRVRCATVLSMIAFLSGVVHSCQSQVVLLVGGVGYGVKVASRVRSKLIVGQSAQLWVHTHVREDALELFGFATEQDRSLFELMMSVSGIGPKMALAILDNSASEIITAVQQADVAFFSRIPRVGKKLAQKIIIELKSKFGALKELELGELSLRHQDVIEALLVLGFAPADAYNAVQNLPDEIKGSPVQEIVKFALKQLAA